jgi:CubicO group peptidase (beta-lactamase class C family)
LTDSYATARELGLMQGFPPPPDKQVNRTNGFMTAPYNRWAYLNMRMLFPSAPVNISAKPAPMNAEIDTAISELGIARGDGAVADFPTFLRETYTDSLLVATPDRLVYEYYDNGMHAAQPHQMMSVTKSFTGLFALMAAEAGLLDEARQVTDIIPELAGASGFAGATVGQVMDMTNSIDFSEDYADTTSGIAQYGLALGLLEVPGATAPDSIYQFLATLQKDPAYDHGEIFRYQTPKTDVVNWVTNRVTGRSFQDQMSQVLWTRIGTEAETYVLLDRCGTLVAGGGLNAAPRDLVRFAQMLLNDGNADGQQIVTPTIIDILQTGGSLEAFSNGTEAVGAFAGGDWSYRAQWWIRHTPGREAIAAIGIHGQWIYVDRRRGVAIVKQSSQPVSADPAADQFILNAFDAVIDHLGGRAVD